MELKNFVGARTGKNFVYITFGMCLCISNYSFARLTSVLFPRHTKSGVARENTIDLLCTFRTYVRYHIKCSKVR